MGWCCSLLSLWCDCGELVAGTGTSRLLYLHFWVLEVGNLCGWDLCISLHMNILGLCIVWWLAVRAKVPRGQANSMQALIKPVSYWPQEILCLSPVSVWEGPTYWYTYQQGPVCQGPPVLTVYLNASYKTCEIWISNIISYTRRCFVLKQWMFWVQHDDSSLCYVVAQFSTLFLISISEETSFTPFWCEAFSPFLPACNQEALLISSSFVCKHSWGARTITEVLKLCTDLPFDPGHAYWLFIM